MVADKKGVTAVLRASRARSGLWVLIRSGRGQVAPVRPRVLGSVAVQTGRLIIFAIFGQRWLARSPFETTKRR